MKRFLALFLVFSLVMLSANLYAKERRGAKLRITKKDGQQIRGELITIKPNSLLLLNTEGKDVSVGIADILSITIVKKSKFWTGAGITFLMALFGGRYFFFWINSLDLSMIEGSVVVWGTILIGGLIGAGMGADKTIRIEGKSQEKIKKAFAKLRKKARIRDYK